jgi:RNA polymerase sigma factor (sigma-70 family)
MLPQNKIPPAAGASAPLSCIELTKRTEVIVILNVLMDLPEDDLALTLRVASDLRARERLAARLASRTRKLCLSLLRNRVDAEDASQVALLEVIRCAPAFRGECRLECWADRITARICIRMARERRLASVRNESDAQLELRPAESADAPWESLPQSIRIYVDQLPEVKRTALLLRHVMDYSIDEIAEYTEVSVNTVKDRLLSAREHLRKLVRQDVVRAEARSQVQRGSV